MKPLSNSYIWFALFAFSFVSYQQITDHLRPGYSGNVPAVKYLLGVAPNFFPALGIPALFVIVIPALQSSHIWLKEKRHMVANAVSLTGLILWEFMQAASPKLHFDWNDIVWTLIGGLLFHLIWTLTPVKYKAT